MTTQQMARDLTKQYGNGAELEAWDRAAIATDSTTRRQYLAVYHYFKALGEMNLPTFVRAASEGEIRTMNSKHMATLGLLVMGDRK